MCSHQRFKIRDDSVAKLRWVEHHNIRTPGRQLMGKNVAVGEVR
jgi:hypothetical protein